VQAVFYRFGWKLESKKKWSKGANTIRGQEDKPLIIMFRQRSSRPNN